MRCGEMGLRRGGTSGVARPPPQSAAVGSGARLAAEARTLTGDAQAHGARTEDCEPLLLPVSACGPFARSRTIRYEHILFDAFLVVDYVSSSTRVYSNKNAK